VTVTATSTAATGESASATGTIIVDVAAIADAPTLDVTVSAGVPGGISATGPAADPAPDDSSVHKIFGTDGNDVIYGHNREEFIDGGAGNDTIIGEGGADVIVGGEGDDKLKGGGGADDLFGGAGNDTLEGGEGADRLFGGEGDDTLEGGEGADILVGGAGNDVLEGGESGHDSQGDIAVFSGLREQYIITQNPDGSFTVHDMFAGRDGTDTVRTVENFQFADGTIADENLLATNPKTFLLDIDAALTDADGSEALSITVSGLPEGASLTFGTKNPDGTWTLTPEEAAQPGLGIIVPYNVVADFNLSVQATSTEADGGDFNTVTQTVHIDAGASAPDLQVSGAVGNEDTTIPLNISAALTDTDGTETLSITISGVPEGATLNHGIRNPDGTWTLDPTTDLTGLTITPPENSNEDFRLTVTATSDEVNDGAASTTAFIDVEVKGVADAPTLDVTAASGDEDSAIALNIGAALTDNDDSEMLSINILGVPDGATLSVGTKNPDGSYTLTPDQLAGLTITPPANSDADFTLTVNAVSKENDGDVATTTKTLSVTVDPIADAPILTVVDATGNEDAAIPLNISSALTDNDGSEDLSITISGVPDGASLSAGIKNADGTYTLTQAQLTGLKITPPANSDADFQLMVTAMSKDGSSTATTEKVINVTVDPVADKPTLTVADAMGDEDTAIALNISSAMTDTDGSETLSISISGMPDGAMLSAGTDNGNGTWTIQDIHHPDGSVTTIAQQLQGLTVTPPQDSDVDFQLSVTATSTDGTSQATSSGTINVTVAGSADAPSLDLDSNAAGDQLEGAASGLEDTAIPLDITTVLTDEDGSETLGVTITIDGLPEGAVLSAGTKNPDGSYTFQDIVNADGTITSVASQLANLTVTPPENSDVDFDLTVTATATEAEGGEASTVGTIHVSVAPDADVPTLVVHDVSGNEDTAIALDISSFVTDDSETLSVKIEGIPADGVLKAGDGSVLVANSDGSYTLTGDQMAGLTLTPGTDFSGDIPLTVTATSRDGDDTAETTGTMTVSVAGVADAPTLDLDPGSDGNQSTGAVAGVAGAAIALNIAAALTDDSETLSITIGGVPTGAVLSAGTDNGDGT
ncbi:MAG: hypothetical protein HYY38_06570, partial [Rhodospirillales bacterium]|nr:hypothetical protein [Rhodospirillales bacterium]